jgi:hypothetical protein
MLILTDKLSIHLFGAGVWSLGNVLSWEVITYLVPIPIIHVHCNGPGSTKLSESDLHAIAFPSTTICRARPVLDGHN